jgi:hypothetical protein
VETSPIRNLITARSPNEHNTSQKIANDYHHVESGAWKARGSIEDVSRGLNQRKEKPQKPEIRLSLWMVAAKQHQNDDEDRQR